jgi:hypothetical protein
MFKDVSACIINCKIPIKTSVCGRYLHLVGGASPTRLQDTNLGFVTKEKL